MFELHYSVDLNELNDDDDDDLMLFDIRQMTRHCIITADVDGEASSVQPLFRCSASLSIPLMSVAPSPDEVQSAVVQAARMILGALKSVTHWSIALHDFDQHPTTSGSITGSKCRRGRDEVYTTIYRRIHMCVGVQIAVFANGYKKLIRR